MAKKPTMAAARKPAIKFVQPRPLLPAAKILERLAKPAPKAAPRELKAISAKRTNKVIIIWKLNE